VRPSTSTAIHGRTEVLFADDTNAGGELRCDPRTRSPAPGLRLPVSTPRAGAWSRRASRVAAAPVRTRNSPRASSSLSVRTRSSTAAGDAPTDASGYMRKRSLLADLVPAGGTRNRATLASGSCRLAYLQAPSRMEPTGFEPVTSCVQRGCGRFELWAGFRFFVQTRGAALGCRSSAGRFAGSEASRKLPRKPVLRAIGAEPRAPAPGPGSGRASCPGRPRFRERGVVVDADRGPFGSGRPVADLLAQDDDVVFRRSRA
jgi:hypothetical protein